MCVRERLHAGRHPAQKPTPAERQMYKRPHPTPHSRVPVQVMPREILAAHQLLAEVEQGLGRLADKPAPHRLG